MNSHKTLNDRANFYRSKCQSLEHRIAGLEAQLAEARKLLDKVVVNDEWFAAPEWQDACDKLLEALAGEE